MLKVSMTLLPVAILAAIGLSGCDKGNKDQSVSSEVVSDTAGISEQPVEVAVVEIDSTEQDGPAPTPKNPMLEMQERIKERLKPEVLGPQLEKNFAQLQETLSSITDVASADEALPKLERFLSGVNQMASLAPLVPPESAAVVGEKMAAAMGPIQAAVDKMYENEEVKAKLAPMIDNVFTTFDSIKAQLLPMEAAEDSDAQAVAAEPDSEPAE